MGSASCLYLFWSVAPNRKGFRRLFFFFFFKDRVFLCSPGCPGTHSVDQAGLLSALPSTSLGCMHTFIFMVGIEYGTLDTADVV
jgi:hypothetical protein